MIDTSTAGDPPLSAALPGTWRLLSRVDVDASGAEHPDPALGYDPVAVLIYDRSGNFSAQFMKRDRRTVTAISSSDAPNNTQARDGYDAYFGTYVVDDPAGVVTQTLLGALSEANVGAVLSRALTVRGDRLVIELATVAWDGEPVIRTLTWTRIG